MPTLFVKCCSIEPNLGDHLAQVLDVAIHRGVQRKKNCPQHVEFSQQQLFQRANHSQRCATKASYVLAYNIAKSNKAFSDGSQLLIFVRGINAHFEITEELAGLQSMKGTTTGADIFCEFENCIDKLRLLIDKLCNVTTDGAPNMAGINQGFVGKFNSKYPENDVFLHCLIHQDALFSLLTNLFCFYNTYISFFKLHLIIIYFIG
ncbi:hypothetical protein QE152_g26568 [Popillia japonica]|uniref:General transcription factor II-I repeat domain-containing protein 2 n=1 Tax=Popillia japonica TaxID=7064 RepID=A0AAW1JXU7_POPJA